MIKIVTAKIHVKDGETMDDLVSMTQERMLEYASKHPDFTCVIDKFIDDGYITVKTLKLEENAN